MGGQRNLSGQLREIHSTWEPVRYRGLVFFSSASCPSSFFFLPQAPEYIYFFLIWVDFPLVYTCQSLAIPYPVTFSEVTLFTAA